MTKRVFEIYYTKDEDEPQDEIRKLRFGDLDAVIKGEYDFYLHTYLKDVYAEDLEDVYMRMQGEVWSPNGEARDLIESKNLGHTSMSVGDIIKDKETGAYFIVDTMGFSILETGRTEELKAALDSMQSNH